uniref:Uncharacterized protein n=1 Tax=Anguilla anguilla TaxID=7936 RepID=A0A0E9RRJ5_ANGAN
MGSGLQCAVTCLIAMCVVNMHVYKRSEKAIVILMCYVGCYNVAITRNCHLEKQSMKIRYAIKH